MSDVKKDADSYESTAEALRTMREVLRDEDDIAAAVLALQYKSGVGDLHFACDDEIDYWTVMFNMVAHRVEVMAERSGEDISEILRDIDKTIQKRQERRQQLIDSTNGEDERRGGGVE